MQNIKENDELMYISTVEENLKLITPVWQARVKKSRNMYQDTGAPANMDLNSIVRMSPEKDSEAEMKNVNLDKKARQMLVKKKQKAQEENLTLSYLK